MANPEHVELLKQGTESWNRWRHMNKDILPDLRGGNLFEVDLRKVNLSGADLNKIRLHDVSLKEATLSRANLSQATLKEVNLREANLSQAILSRANLFDVDLRSANLSGTDVSKAYLSGVNLSQANLKKADLSEARVERANLSWVNLFKADLRSANLSGADLTEASLRDANLFDADLSGVRFLGTNLTDAELSGCRVYGISAWDVKLDGATQTNLIITRNGEPRITVDSLEIAQFVHMLIHNEKIRDVIDTIGKKAVLILGRFTPERKAVLDAIREELRKHNYIPILFDFEKPSSRDLTETIVTLAHLSRFIIADLTDPSSLPHELKSIVPNLPSVAVQPIVNKNSQPYTMFEHLQRYPWVLPIHEYETQERLVSELTEKIIEPAEAKVKEIRPPS